MLCFYSDVLIKIIKVVFILRLITYGTTNLSRYLLWKHEKRLLNGTAVDVSKVKVKKSLMSKYVPITVGVGLLGVLQWRYVSRRLHPPEGESVREASKWEVTVYTLLPLRIMSRIWGTLTSIDLPVFLRPKIYSFYAKSFGVNMDECKVQEFTLYRNLSEFFIRPLKEDCRPIDADMKCVVSPADGRVLSFGKITSCQVDQVKGVTYSLQQFLGQQSWKDTNNNSERKSSKSTSSQTETSNSNSTDSLSQSEEQLVVASTFLGFGGATAAPNDISSSLPNDVYLKRLKEKEDTELYQCVVYLAPGDYHRFHSPVSWQVGFRRHFQGKLLSVNPAIASWIRNLFSLNERAVYVGSWHHGFFSLTAVGATNVGSIKVAFDPSLHTNRWNVKPRHRDLFFNANSRSAPPTHSSNNSNQNNIQINKGELFGEFRLGSTIVLIFEAPKNFQFNIQCGQKIKYGQKIGAFS